MGLAILLSIILAILVGPFLSPYHADTPVVTSENRCRAPSAEHWFGTDKYGRDVLTRVLVGGRLSLGLGLGVIFIAMTVGSLYGAAAGYAGGILDFILMRVLDVLLSFPLIFLAITCMALFGGGIFYLDFVLGLTSWMDIARLVRAEVHSLKNRSMTIRAKASGLAESRIVMKHLLPNTFPTLIAILVIRLADIILIESSLSFIGLGVQPPQASWGAMINDGRMAFLPSWWVSLFPALAIFIVTSSLNMIGRGLKPGN